MLTRAQKGLILPASGGGQAYAERTSSTGQIGVGDGATGTNIAGLTITAVPDSTQALAILHCPRIDKSATAGWVSISISDTAGTTLYNTALQSIPASNFAALTSIALITGLTPGTPFTIKGFLTTSASTAAVFSAPTQKAFIAALRV